MESPISESEIENEVIKLVRDKLGAVASFKKAFVIKSLPKTRSGKILRSTIAKILNNQDYNKPATIEDESTLNLVIKLKDKI